MIGFYRHLVEILKASFIPDEAGGARREWTNVESAWAAIELLAPQGQGGGERSAPPRRIAAAMRFRPGVCVGNRLRFADADYDIVAVEAGPDGRRMRLVCDEAPPEAP